MNWVPFYCSTYGNCKVTPSFHNLITFKSLIMSKKGKIHSSIEYDRCLKYIVLLNIIEGFYVISKL